MAENNAIQLSKHGFEMPSLKVFDDYFFAVFNSTEHDRAVARRKFIAKFGESAWKKEVLPFQRTGIMEVFRHECTKYLDFYTLEIAKNADNRHWKRRKRREDAAQSANAGENESTITE